MTATLQIGDRVRVLETCTRKGLRGKRGVIRGVDGSKGKPYWVYIYKQTEYWFKETELEKV